MNCTKKTISCIMALILAFSAVFQGIPAVRSIEHHDEENLTVGSLEAVTTEYIEEDREPGTSEVVETICEGLSPATETMSSESIVPMAANIVINGVDIGYADNDYFTKDGGSCKNTYWSNGRCHHNGVCTSTAHEQCNCMRYWPTGKASTCEVDLLGSQCLAYARYCQWIVYGTYATGTSSYYSDLTGSVSKSNCTADNLKSLLYGCAPATHVRMPSPHSISIISTTDSGVTFTDCNAGGYCQIRVVYNSWADFATYIQGKGGIEWAYSRNGVGGGTVSCTCSDSYAGDYLCTTASANLNIRSGHGSGYPVIGAIPSGATVSVSKASGTGSSDWAHVTYNGVSGYASMQYLQKIEVSVSVSPAIYTWMAETAYGEEINTFKAGNRYYLCYRIYDKVSGKDWDEVADRDYTVDLTYYNTDGSVLFGSQFTDDRSWISVFFSESGTYSFGYTVSGELSGSSMESFTIEADPKQIYASANSVSLRLGGTESATINVWTEGYYNGSTILSCSRSNSNVSCSWGTQDDDGRYPLTITANTAGTTTITLSAKVSDTGDVLDSITLTVTVSANSYTVSYHANGGSGAPSSQSKQHGTDLKLSSTVPTGKSYTISFNGNGGTVAASSKKVYQTFSKWNTLANGSGDSYVAGGTYSANSSCTLYAQWYDAERGSVTNPVREGYTFVGWYDSTATDAEGFPSGTKYTNSTDVLSNITLYAMWGSAGVLYYGDVDLDGSVTITDITAINAYRLGNRDPEYAVEEFELRSDVDRDGSVTLDDIDIINNLRLNNLTQAEVAEGYTGTSVSAYPKTSYSYGSALDTSGLEIDIAFDTGMAFRISEGLTVSGFDPYRSGTQTLTVSFYQFSTTYTVTVAAQKYTVSYNANGGSGAPASQSKTAGTALILSSSIPTRFGYTFLGWSTSSDSTVATYLPSDSFTTDANTTLYAVWQSAVPISVGGDAYSYSTAISFANGYKYYQFTPNFSGKLQFESTSGGDTQIYLYDTAGNQLASDDDSGEGANFLLSYAVTSGSKYYLKVKHYSSGTGTIAFSVKQVYDITYDANGGSGAPGIQLKLHGTSLVLSSTVPTRSGYTFLGWSMSSTSSSTSYQPGDSFNLNANTTLYAVWAKNTYKVNYNANGGSGAPSSQTKTHGEPLTLSLIVPTRTGYTFLGWSTNSTATSASYQPGGSFTTNADTTLYAVWSENCDNGHSYTYKVTKVPTSSAAGTLTGTCSMCSDTTTVTLPKLSTVDYSYTVTKAATCTAAGTGRYTWKITTYGSFYFDVSIDPLGHSWDNGVVTREPTENTAGELCYTCTTCGDTKTESIPPIGHQHDYRAFVIDPTCTEQGYTMYFCECGDGYAADYVDALGHSFGAWVVIQQPTVDEDGVEARVCSRCKHAEQRSIPKQENPFTDVPVGSFYYEPVMWAVENGITNGTTSTTFGPNDQCMRAHVVTFLWRAMGSPEPKLMVNPFVDVKSTDFYYKPVIWALENGITSGLDATHFGPTAYCNRAQVVTFLYRTMGNPDVGASTNPFTDVAAGSFYEKPVLWAVENGVTAGLSATSFGPNAICNRAQIVTFLYRAFVTD